MERIKSIRAGNKTVKVNWDESVTDVDYNNAVAMASVISRGAYIKEEIVEDFAFTVYGNRFTVGLRSGENPNFTIDWGDGTETIVDGTSDTQRTHNYPSASEWTITIKNYASGWLNFSQSDTTYSKLLRVLTPFPKSDTRISFYGCFNFRSSLVSIPDKLFANNPNADDFGACFSNCTALVSIPENIFSKNTLAYNFTSCFSACSGLMSIPDKLFANNPNAEYFYDCFGGCSSLISIPDRLFMNNLRALTFMSCFKGCSSLISIPKMLFSYNPSIENISSCFEGCKNLSNIDIVLHPDVLSRETNYMRMFLVSSESLSHTGKAPELWNSATAKLSYKTDCFRNCTALANYDEIPAGWK